MEKLALSFLVLVNPFAQFLYLKDVADDLELKTFASVYGRASIMSTAIYLLFALLGEDVFNHFFNIKFEAFRIFGGIIIFSYAFLFIMNGTKGMVRMKENLEDLASEIALPFIVGAGTIYLSIIIGLKTPHFGWVLGIIVGVMIINYITVIGLSFIKDLLKRKRQIAFDKYIGIAMRLNGFLMGAIGVNMIIDGIIGVLTT